MRAAFPLMTVMLAAGALLLPGCFLDRKKPIPQIAVTVTTDPNRFLLDGQPMGYDQVQSELKAAADRNRQSATGNARAYVKIITDPGASYDVTLSLVDYCASVGLDKVETTGR